MEQNDWISLHIYPSKYIDRIDSFIATDLKGIADSASAEWFYIRYTDAKGAHIRYRLRAAGLDVDFLREAVMQAVAELPFRDVNAATPLVTMGTPPSPPSQEPAHVNLDPYLAEFDKYGGIEGVHIAERHFVASTRVAVAILAAEGARGVSRKSLAPRLMADALREVLPAAQWGRFCTTYRQHWLDFTKAANLLPGFERTAQRLVAENVPILQGDDTFPGDMAGLLREWRAALASTFAAYDGLDPSAADRQRTMLLSSFLHLMNNMLGFNLIDEAYLATVVGTALECEGARDAA